MSAAATPQPSGSGEAVAYPELVSRGVSKSQKFKRLVKVGASMGVIRVD